MIAATVAPPTPKNVFQIYKSVILIFIMVLSEIMWLLHYIGVAWTN